MHALQFVKAFADFTGQDYASLRVIDRALAEAGLRQKAKGRKLPDVTLNEGVLFLFAVLANTQPTRSAGAAVELAEAQCVSMPGHSHWRSFINLAHAIKWPDAKKLSRLKPSLNPLRPAPPIGIRLIDAVRIFCRDTKEGAWAELSVHRAGPAYLTFAKTFEAEGDQMEFRPREAQIGFLTETRTASPALMRWIGENTVGETPMDWRG